MVWIQWYIIYNFFSEVLFPLNANYEVKDYWILMKELGTKYSVFILQQKPYLMSYYQCIPLMSNEYSFQIIIFILRILYNL